MTITTVSREILVQCPAATAFAALIDPERLAQWYTFARPQAIEPVVGGRYDMCDPEGNTVIQGEILKLVANSTLQHSFQFTNPDLDQSESVVTWTISSTANGSQIELVHEGLDLSTGWDQLLPQLKAYLEQQ